jgi:hypothetical protein
MFIRQVKLSNSGNENLVKIDYFPIHPFGVSHSRISIFPHFLILPIFTFLVLTSLCTVKIRWKLHERITGNGKVNFHQRGAAIIFLPPNGIVAEISQTGF